MVRHPAVARIFLLSFLLLLLPFATRAAQNPHVSMDACPACHVSIPAPEEVATGDFRLLRATIDATCRNCHADTACALGTGKVVHPSGIDTWDPAVCDGPRTLPLYEGRITCATCHEHLKPVGPDFKMVRNVRFRDGRPELDAFCADCHLEYY